MQIQGANHYNQGLAYRPSKKANQAECGETDRRVVFLTPETIAAEVSTHSLIIS